MPLYEITAVDTPEFPPRLIEAKTKTGALSYAAKSFLKVEKCTAMRAHTLAARGTKIEKVEDDT
jgi:hypothetical protein